MSDGFIITINHSVLQPWVMQLGWKMQSILLSGFRGPDDAELPATKAVNRWLRTVSQNNADPSKDYMRQDTLPTDLQLCEELEWRSCHYTHHLADALRIVAIYHPQIGERTKAFIYHNRIAEEIFHFMPEPDDVFIARHEDKVVGPEKTVVFQKPPIMSAVPLVDAQGNLVGARVRVVYHSSEGTYEAWDYGNEGGTGKPVDDKP